MPFKNKELEKIYFQNYYIKNKQKKIETSAKFYLDNKEYILARNKEHYNNIDKPKYRKQKIEVFIAYSKSGKCECNCCQETILEFLTLDHINNDGAIKRKAGQRKGQTLYTYLKSHDYPDKDKFQVLCFNCNSGRNINGGICPHQQLKLLSGI